MYLYNIQRSLSKSYDRAFIENNNDTLLIPYEPITMTTSLQFTRFQISQNLRINTISLFSETMCSEQQAAIQTNFSINIPYQGVRNVNFSENSVYALNYLFLLILKILKGNIGLTLDS